MGCAESNQVFNAMPFDPIPSPVGVLRITLTNCMITNYDSMMATIDPYVGIRLSNQNFSTLVKQQVNKNN